VFHYSVYGVLLCSDVALPELDRLATAIETEHVSINLRLSDVSTSDPIAPRWFLSSTPSNRDNLALCGKVEGGYLLRYPGYADFIVDSAGRDLQCARVEPGTSLQTLRHLLLDRVLPLVLNLTGHNVLHATAVDTPAGVCAFVGPAGAGKSTLTACFAIAGYTVLCDDCLVVRINGGIHCLPGYPGVRLWSDSLSVIGNLPIGESDTSTSTSKVRILTNSEPLPGGYRPLIGIYRIARETGGRPTVSATRVERLTGCEAFIELASASYVLDVTEPSTLLRHFRFIERLVAGVPVHRLSLASDFAGLPEARRLILSELQSPGMN
jgi:hypothetical protein